MYQKVLDLCHLEEISTREERNSLKKESFILEQEALYKRRKKLECVLCDTQEGVEFCNIVGFDALESRNGGGFSLVLLLLRTQRIKGVRRDSVQEWLPSEYGVYSKFRNSLQNGIKPNIPFSETIYDPFCDGFFLYPYHPTYLQVSQDQQREIEGIYSLLKTRQIIEID